MVEEAIALFLEVQLGASLVLVPAESAWCEVVWRGQGMWLMVEISSRTL